MKIHMHVRMKVQIDDPEVYFKLQEKLEAEKTAREAAEVKVAVQEKEMEAWRRSDGKWRREVETREEMLKGLRAHSKKKSATIEKLKENLGHLEHAIHERDERVKYLEREVKIERWEISIAFERARLAHQNVENIQAQLKEEVDAHEKLQKEATRATLEAERQRESSLTEVQALKGRLDYLESEAHRVEVVEKYRNSTVGKVEVALTCKAGFDYFKNQLHPNLKLDLDWFHYPPQVANCLDALKEIEARGGGLVVDADNGDDEGEESGGGFDQDCSSSQAEDDEEAGSEPHSTPQPTPTPTNSPTAAPALATPQHLSFGPKAAPTPSRVP